MACPICHRSLSAVHDAGDRAEDIGLVDVDVDVMLRFLTASCEATRAGVGAAT
jgi:hypothetical protein